MQRGGSDKVAFLKDSSLRIPSLKGVFMHSISTLYGHTMQF